MAVRTVQKVVVFFALSAMGIFMASAKSPPQFVEHTIATNLANGYQVVVADLNKDGKPDLIALASGMSELVWFENPDWQRHVIASNFTKMINLVVLESGTQPMIVLASRFSNEAKNSQGLISVLEPNGDVRGQWKVRNIDRIPTSHRLRLADIDGSGVPVVINAPLTSASAMPPLYRGYTPLMYYKPGEWRRTMIGVLRDGKILTENEGVVHGICAVDWDGDRRDEILTAGFSGIHLYELDRFKKRWIHTEIARGDPSPCPNCGTSDVAVGQLAGRRFLCSIEPWHGNQLVVYREENKKWMRHVIDNSFSEGHALCCADLDGDGRDEIIAGYRLDGGGLFIYYAEDEQGLRWRRTDLDKGGIAASSCAVADLNGDGKPDIVAIGSATANLKWYENKTTER